MANIKARGLILKQSDYGEGNRMLTVFCEGYGIIKASTYGIKGPKSKQAAASQFLSYGTFLLFQGKGDVLRVNSVEPIECFFPIQENITALALGAYLADITFAALDMQTPDDGLLRMLLNTLYMMAYKDMPLAVLKAVYELRLSMHAGFTPVTDFCTVCGSTENLCVFSLENNGMVCKECAGKKPGGIALSPACFHALYYILHAQPKQVFRFQIGEDVQRELGALAERYILRQLEKEFASLTYYKRMI